jgi:tricorn protease interacting factor F2/3
MASQFAAIDARKAFACFDEPDQKATFRFRIKHDKSLTARSNMPAKNRTEM